MERWLRAARRIDRAHEWLGHAVAWLTLLMVLVGAGNAILRYLGRFAGRNLSSNALVEGQWYLFSVVFLLAASWTLASGRHVRVDVVYGRLGPRARTWIDLLGGVLFLLPFCVFAVTVSWPSAASSFAVREVSPDPGGLPRWPIRALIPIAFVLLALQGVSQVVQCVARLRGDLPLEDPEGDAAVRSLEGT